MPATVPSAKDIKSMVPALGTSTWVAIIGLIAVGLLIAIALGFKPLNLK